MCAHSVDAGLHLVWSASCASRLAWQQLRHSAATVLSVLRDLLHGSPALRQSVRVLALVHMRHRYPPRPESLRELVYLLRWQ